MRNLRGAPTLPINVDDALRSQLPICLRNISRMSSTTSDARIHSASDSRLIQLTVSRAKPHTTLISALEHFSRNFFLTGQTPRTTSPVLVDCSECCASSCRPRALMTPTSEAPQTRPMTSNPECETGLRVLQRWPTEELSCSLPVTINLHTVSSTCCSL